MRTSTSSCPRLVFPLATDFYRIPINVSARSFSKKQQLPECRWTVLTSHIDHSNEWRFWSKVGKQLFRTKLTYYCRATRHADVDFLLVLVALSFPKVQQSLNSLLFSMSCQRQNIITFCSVSFLTSWLDLQWLQFIECICPFLLQLVHHSKTCCFNYCLY